MLKKLQHYLGVTSARDVEYLKARIVSLEAANELAIESFRSSVGAFMKCSAENARLKQENERLNAVVADLQDALKQIDRIDSMPVKSSEG